MSDNKSFAARLAVALLCFSLCLGPIPARADWFSGLIDNLQTNSPSAWEGQKRGYFTGGGMTIRNQASRNPLFNIQPPRINAGCGGIDVFWGGFSYLNPEYLIKMFQNIMTAAPAYAFKLALDQLCAPCGKIIAELKALADAVNSAALDECGLASSMVAMGGDAVASMIGMDMQKGTNTGDTWVSDLISKTTATVNDFVAKGRQLQGWMYCGGLQNHDPARFEKCMKFADITGAIWDRAQRAGTEEQRDLDETFIDIARAYFGEMIITESEAADGGDGTDGKSMYKVDFRPACDSTGGASGLVRNMLGNMSIAGAPGSATMQPGTTPSGDTSSALVTPGAANKDATTFDASTQIMMMQVNRDGSGKATAFKGCQPAPIPAALKVKIHERSQRAIQAISESMQNNPGTTLDQETIQVVMNSRIPVYQVINSLAYRGYYGGVITGAEQEALVKITTIGYAQYVLEEFVNKAEGALDRAFLQMKNSREGMPVAPESYETGYKSIKDNIKTFRAAFAAGFGMAYEEFQNAFKQNNEFIQMREHFISLIKKRDMRSVF